MADPAEPFYRDPAFKIMEHSRGNATIIDRRDLDALRRRVVAGAHKRLRTALSSVLAGIENEEASICLFCSGRHDLDDEGRHVGGIQHKDSCPVTPRPHPRRARADRWGAGRNRTAQPPRRSVGPTGRPAAHRRGKGEG